MAQTKVSDLTELTSPDGAEELLINDGGTSKKITIANAVKATDLPTAPSGISDDTNKEYNLKLTDVSGTETLTWVEETDDDTTYSDFTGDSGAGGAAGLVPAPGAGDTAAGKYLDADGSWTVPPDTDTNTTYTAGDFKLDDLATPDDNTDLDFSTTRHGLVPKGTDTGAFLKDDGSWGTPTDTNTTYTAGDLLDLDGSEFDVDLSELTDGTTDVVGSEDELVYLDDSSQKRKLISEIKLGQFNNDQSWTANAGTMTEVADDTTPQLGGDLDCNGSQIQWSQGADVASTGALPVLTDGNYFDVTGTTAITSINTTGGVGTLIKLHFDGALTLTHHATDLILPSGANITTAAGDEAEFIEYAAGDYRCTNYSKASGEAVIGGAGATGGGSDEVFYENDQTITTNYELTAGKNAMSAGAITINSSISVTVPSGATWVIV